MTPDAIVAIVREKAVIHAELRAPLSYAGLRAILAREHVGLVVGDLPRPALLMQFGGKWSIIVDASVPKRRHLDYAAHELGHLWLHHDPTAERWERVYNMDDWIGPDPREDEVELFCTIVLGSVRYL